MCRIALFDERLTKALCETFCASLCRISGLKCQPAVGDCGSLRVSDKAQRARTKQAMCMETVCTLCSSGTSLIGQMNRRRAESDETGHRTGTRPICEWHSIRTLNRKAETAILLARCECAVYNVHRQSDECWQPTAKAINHCSSSVPTSDSVTSALANCSFPRWAPLFTTDPSNL